MKNAIKSADIKWLTDGVTSNTYVPGKLFKHSVPMDEQLGRGEVEIFSLQLGLDIAHGVHHFTPAADGQLMPMAEITGELDEPMFEIQSAHRGRVVMEERAVGKRLIFGKGKDLFLHIDHLDYVPHLDCSGTVEVFVLKAGVSILSLLLGEQSATTLMSKLGLNQVNRAQVLLIPPHIRSLLYQVVSPHLQGDIRLIHAQSKAIEYLSSLTVLFAGENESSHEILSSLRVKRLYDELVTTQGKIPTLDILAKRYGVSARTLNDEFKNHYGKPIVTFICEYRLDQAHTALRESDVAMKVLADRLGFSHVNHFINAFKRRFGYTPGSIRR